MYLSKSRYTSGITCPKILWMDKYMPEEYILDETTKARFKAGSEVGELATHLFKNCVTVKYSDNKSLMINKTKKLMDEGHENIAEASFAFDEQFCSVDILQKTGDGWNIIEVKSSTELKEIYIDDMSYQYYVLKNCGLKIDRVFNMHLNNKYERHGNLNLEKLFVLEDCTEDVLIKYSDVAGNIESINAFMEKAGDIEPNMAPGTYCYKPYDCPYREYCFKDYPKPSVLDIMGGMWKSTKCNMFNEGIKTFQELLDSGKQLGDKSKRQVETEVYDLKPYVNKKELKKYLDELTYPLYFLDFETYQKAIPEYDGITPYMQFPFQYSLHIQHAKGAEPEHREHLGISGTDTRRKLAEQMVKDIPDDACVLAYNMKFEKGVIKKLARQYEDLSDHLMKIHDNMKDLEVPFRSHYYYCKEFAGSSSIKKVLPALCPGDPELDYLNLDDVHNGTEAMTLFPRLNEYSKEEQDRLRKSLLAYCRLDTLAMVKILEIIYEINNK